MRKGWLAAMTGWGMAVGAAVHGQSPAVTGAAADAPQAATAMIPSAQTQPAAGNIEPQSARIAKLSGTVQYALPDAAGNAGPWQEAREGDLLPAGTRIRTRLRSHVVLMFGDNTVAMIDRATLASIDEFHRAGDTQHIRLGLGHGAVRAGVAETTLRSDMTIATPTATLSKKGTMDFGIEYEPSTGRYRIYLARSGLVEALDQSTGKRREILPGQWVTEAMVRWIETALFDRAVELADVFGISGPEALFNANTVSGIGVIDPGGGFTAISYGVRGGGLPGGGRLPFGGAGVAAAALPFVLTPGGERILVRPEGNFGTGNAAVPQIISRFR